MSEPFERDLLRGSLDMMVLSVLNEQAQYGYAIQKKILGASGGRVDLKAGTLYPLLHRLEANKWIRSRWDETTGRRRKWYELTSLGRRRLRQQANEWQQYAECVSQLLSPVWATSPKPA